MPAAPYGDRALDAHEAEITGEPVAHSLARIAATCLFRACNEQSSIMRDYLVIEAIDYLGLANAAAPDDAQIADWLRRALAVQSSLGCSPEALDKLSAEMFDAFCDARPVLAGSAGA